MLTLPSTSEAAEPLLADHVHSALTVPSLQLKLIVQLTPQLREQASRTSPGDFLKHPADVNTPRHTAGPTSKRLRGRTGQAVGELPAGGPARGPAPTATSLERALHSHSSQTRATTDQKAVKSCDLRIPQLGFPGGFLEHVQDQGDVTSHRCNSNPHLSFRVNYERSVC